MFERCRPAGAVPSSPAHSCCIGTGHADGAFDSAGMSGSPSVYLSSPDMKGSVIANGGECEMPNPRTSPIALGRRVDRQEAHHEVVEVVAPLDHRPVTAVPEDVQIRVGQQL